MSGLKNTKRRIVSAKNTQKVTRAMKLVSSAKFARAHHNIAKAKFFGESLDKLLFKLSPLFTKSRESLKLTEKRKEKKILLIVVTSDRGLCGALNSNVLKLANSFLEEKAQKGVICELLLWGRKSHILSRKYTKSPASSAQKVIDKPDYFYCKKELSNIFKGFKSEAWDSVYVIFSKFKNVISQQAQVFSFLPFAFPEETQPVDLNVIAEPSSVEFLEGVIETKLNDVLFQILLDSAASDHAARMTAMDSATSNADKVITDLTLEYNRARQAAITKELIEITSGAEAL
jgi:F-type H+-transporting ATPase subunit gamma